MRPISWKSMKFRIPVLALAACALPLASAATEDWKPTQPVELVVAAGPGGSLDQVARMLEKIMQDQGTVPTMIVSNRPSGAGLVAMSVLQQHPGDGHYLASWAAQWLTNYARGNHIHIGAAKPLLAAGIDVAKLTIVPFKSSAETLLAAMGGHLDVVAATTPNLVAQLQAGKIRVIAVSSPERLGGVFADAPTWKEQGIDSEYASAQGIMGPKGLSKSQIDFWSNALRRAVEAPEWQAFVERNQWKPRFLEGEAARQYVESELIELRKVLGAMQMAKH